MLMLPVGTAHTVDWRPSQVAHLMASDRYISGANDEAALSEDWRIRAVPAGVLKLVPVLDLVEITFFHSLITQRSAVFEDDARLIVVCHCCAACYIRIDATSTICEWRQSHFRAG